LSPDNPERAAAKAVIVEEVERLRWRLWNGKAQDAGISLDRIQAAMHHFSVAPSRKLWTALRALNDYLIGQSDWLVNYAERHRAGLRVGTALTGCSRSAAPSTTARSALASGSASRPPTTSTRQQSSLPDPQTSGSPLVHLLPELPR
jgi:hypothetical protein